MIVKIKKNVYHIYYAKIHNNVDMFLGVIKHKNNKHTHLVHYLHYFPKVQCCFCFVWV